MHFLIIADSFPPSKNSIAVQIDHLAREFNNQNHNVTLFIPSPDIKESYKIRELDYAKVIFIKVPLLKSSRNIVRALAELYMPFLMVRTIKRNKLFNFIPDGIIWYSPSIFHGYLIKYLKKTSNSRSYLVIRDIFPEWALDLKLMKKGLIYYFFRAIANYQYNQADIIGVQSPGNLKYFNNQPKGNYFTIEVLNNWLLKDIKKQECSISIDNSKLKGRKIFVYAGNMGIAQGMDILLDLAHSFIHRDDIGFVFVGRGARMKVLSDRAEHLNLENILFYEEINPNEIPLLYDQCSAGLISLDLRHESHNIPGKFLSYMQSGLPILASVNPGNDLINIVESSKVGYISSDGNINKLILNADKLISELDKGYNFSISCKNVFNESYNAEMIVKQIVNNFLK